MVWLLRGRSVVHQDWCKLYYYCAGRGFFKGLLRGGAWGGTPPRILDIPCCRFVAAWSRAAQRGVSSSCAAPGVAWAAWEGAGFFCLARLFAACRHLSMRRWHFWQAAMTWSGFVQGGLQLHRWAVLSLILPFAQPARWWWRSVHLRPLWWPHWPVHSQRSLART
jgi:hypothetical protein